MSAFFRADIVLYVYCIICTFWGFSSHWSVPGAEVSCTVWTVRLAAHLAHRHKVTQSVTKQTNTLDSEKIMEKSGSNCGHLQESAGQALHFATQVAPTILWQEVQVWTTTQEGLRQEKQEGGRTFSPGVSESCL